MPSKKRKYNARFPAGRIKKIMQTDEEVGKVAQAVPIIISRTLELFVESLLKKSMEVTLSRNAKTLSPSHVKQCILSESRFDFLKDLVRNVPSVSAAEERELSLQSANSSPTEPRYPDQAAAQMELLRLQQQSSSQPSTSRSQQPPSQLRGRRPQTHSHPPTETSVQPEIHQNYNGKQNSIQRIPDQVQPEDLTRRRVPNFYQETLPDSDSSQSQDLISNHNSVIQVNPAYTVRQLSVDAAEPKKDFSQRQPAAPHFHVDLTRVPLQTSSSFESALQPRPILNFDFSNPLRPEVRYGSYDPASGPPPVQTPAQNHTPKPSPAQNHASRPSLAQRSHSLKEPPALVPISSLQIRPVPALEIDEDYDT